MAALASTLGRVMPVHGEVWVIVVAAGAGSRFAGDTPKQFVEIAGRRTVDWSVIAAATVADGIVVVMPPDGDGAPPRSDDVPIHAVPGGATRSASVRRGLAAVPDHARVILVHDAARPAATPALFARVVEAVDAGADAIVPVVPVVDTLRHVDGADVDRDKLQAVQTPQGFSATSLRQAHASAGEATDDAGLVVAAGGDVGTVAGERWNLKLTEVADTAVLAAVLGHVRP